MIYTRATYTVSILVDDNGLTERGSERLGDALSDADLEGTLHDAAADAIAAALPKDFPDVVSVRVTTVRVIVTCSTCGLLGAFYVSPECHLDGAKMRAENLKERHACPRAGTTTTVEE